MKRILLVVMLLSTIACTNAQTKPAVTGTGVKITAPPAEKTLVADETEVIASGKSSFRIISSNATISQKIKDKFGSSHITRINQTKKHDRGGDYWEISFYFKNESWNEVANFINTNCK